MIINALCDYYDILAQDEKSGISMHGYERTEFFYEIVLTEEGELSAVTSIVVDKKENKPKSAIMPKSMKIPGIAASPVCDNMAYIFGVDRKKIENKMENIIDARKFDAAKELHLRLFENAVSKEAIAIKKYFEKWDVETAWENELIFSAANNAGNAFSGNAAFRLKGEKKYFHECDEIRNIWLEKNKAKAAAVGECIAQCSVTGAISPIAKLHTQLSGVRGAQATGASLVCFNKDSDESYNLSQSYNSRVSESAMFKYTTALQYLLKSKKNKLYIGDDTTLFWACSPDKIYENAAWLMFGGNFDEEDQAKISDENAVDREAEETVKSILEHGIKGIPINPDFDPDVQFYVLGLAPNAGRISIRYFYQNSFEDFCDKITRYYEDASICGKNKYIKAGSMLFSTVSSNSSDKKVNPLLGGAVMRAILSGGDYPRLLFNQVILRVKAEANVNQARAAAIKAYLTRNEREEWLSVYLNEESKNTAYVLGRTFAILEKIQKDASGGKLNSTIKNKYFATACSNPALAFPSLLKLAQHHLAKIDGNYLNNRLQECLAFIEGENFPKTQGMDAQGSFILGYYQQNAKLYEKRENKENEEENPNGTDID